jgi:hypothetical protein
MAPAPAVILTVVNAVDAEKPMVVAPLPVVVNELILDTKSISNEAANAALAVTIVTVLVSVDVPPSITSVAP